MDEKLKDLLSELYDLIYCLEEVNIKRCDNIIDSMKSIFFDLKKQFLKTNVCLQDVKIIDECLKLLNFLKCYEIDSRQFVVSTYLLPLLKHVIELEPLIYMIEIGLAIGSTTLEGLVILLETEDCEREFVRELCIEFTVEQEERSN